VERILDRIAQASRTETVSLDDILRAFGTQSFLPMLMVPGLLLVSPLSGIPLFSSLCGMTIAFISFQMIGHRSHLWLPDVIVRQQVAGARAHAAVGRLARLARWLDRHTGNRLLVLVSPPLDRMIPILCLICGAVMPLLELLPFSSSLMGLAVVLFATALLTRDGLCVLLGMAVMALALAVPVLAVTAIETVVDG
jgi:hypothetical protein